MTEIRPIDANALIGFLHNQEFIDGDDRSRVYRWIEEQPTIKSEVRHGRWIFKKGDNKSTVDGWICTACKYGFHTKVPYFEAFKYCPMCGARNVTDTSVNGKGK